MPRNALPIVLAVALCATVLPAAAQEAQDPAVLRGVQHLRGQARGLGAGEAALAALAMVKAEVPANDPGLAAMLQTVLARFNGTYYTPERGAQGGVSIYEAGVTSLLLCNLDPIAYKPQIEAVAQFIMSCQLPNGGWDYVGRPHGDTSISQYAVLGLWEAENAGAIVPARVWDRAAKWYLSVQDGEGGWCYHRDDPGSRDTVSMTAAGVGSLLICQRQLAAHRAMVEASNPLLTPVVTDPRSSGNYKAEVTNGQLNAAINRGLGWLAPRFNPASKEIMGQSTYYGLYGIERIGALADKQRLGGADWFERGRSFILSTQQADGSWNEHYGTVTNTSWAILFITKSTAKTLRRIQIQRLGAGTLIGGRGLPKDLSSLTIAGGRVLSRPMNGAVEGMLDVLEDPRKEADSALAGLVSQYQSEGPGILRPHKDRFRKLLADRDPGIRSVAAWALGRTGDLDVAPDLIAALEDEDETVVGQARAGLQILSRKIIGYGPERGASPAERTSAARRWRQWYDRVKAPEFSATAEAQPARR